MLQELIIYQFLSGALDITILYGLRRTWTLSFSLKFRIVQGVGLNTDDTSSMKVFYESKKCTLDARFSRVHSDCLSGKNDDKKIE